MTTSHLVPAIVLPVIGWRVYRRVRRNIGRQHLSPTRLNVSTAIMGLVLLAVGTVSFRSGALLAGLGAGLVLGAALGVVGYRLTSFGRDEKGITYTPNAYLGVGVSMLFIGRMVYRLLTVSSAMQDGPEAFAQVQQSPLTLVLFGLTFGYFICYNLLLLTGGEKRAASETTKP